MRLKHTYKRQVSAEASWIALRLVIAWAVLAVVLVAAVVIPAGLAERGTVTIEPTVSTGP